jgi:hypothetical protein
VIEGHVGQAPPYVPIVRQCASQDDGDVIVGFVVRVAAGAAAEEDQGLDHAGEGRFHSLLVGEQFGCGFGGDAVGQPGGAGEDFVQVDHRPGGRYRLGQGRQAGERLRPVLGLA